MKETLKMCRWKGKRIEKRFDEYVNLVRHPHFVCMRCGRVAAEAGQLCQPKPLKAD